MHEGLKAALHLACIRFRQRHNLPHIPGAELHDALHALLDLPPTPEGESELILLQVALGLPMSIDELARQSLPPSLPMEAFALTLSMRGATGDGFSTSAGMGVLMARALAGESSTTPDHPDGDGTEPKKAHSATDLG